MLEFIKRYKKILIVCVFFLIPLLVISTRSRNIRSSTWYEHILIFISAPFQSIANSVGDNIGSIFTKYFFLVGRYDENVLLREENLRLRGANYRLREIQQENIRLRELLNFKRQTGESELLPAEVIAVDAKSEFRTIRINKGSVDGVKEQLPVVTSGGIVGQILKSYRHYSDVLLITDRYSAVDAIIQRIRSRGVIEGNVNDCNLKHVLRSDDVKKGDLIISSGLDLIFPKGLPLGIVSDVKKEKYGIVQEVSVDPVVDFDRLEEVLVVLNQSVRAVLDHSLSDKK